jgi:5'-3' exonuclease
MGDSTDGIPGLPKVGPKTADAWLKDVSRDVMPQFTLNKYIEKFGNHEGILKFVETFRLIYILKNPEEVKLETGVELPKLEITKINDNIEKSEDLWL